jgi:hypothetical protein
MIDNITNTVTVTAVITDTEGKELFRSSHTTPGASILAAGKFQFNSIIHPMELVLTDAQRQFIPAPKDEDEGNESEPIQAPNTPGDDAIASGGSE